MIDNLQEKQKILEEKESEPQIEDNDKDYLETLWNTRHEGGSDE